MASLERFIRYYSDNTNLFLESIREVSWKPCLRLLNADALPKFSSDQIQAVLIYSDCSIIFCSVVLIKICLYGVTQDLLSPLKCYITFSPPSRDIL